MKLCFLWFNHVLISTTPPFLTAFPQSSVYGTREKQKRPLVVCVHDPIQQLRRKRWTYLKFGSTSLNLKIFTTLHSVSLRKFKLLDNRHVRISDFLVTKLQIWIVNVQPGSGFCF